MNRDIRTQASEIRLRYTYVSVTFDWGPYVQIITGKSFAFGHVKTALASHPTQDFGFHDPVGTGPFYG